ncbi:MAG: aldehyde:ferredoxin oxidoreductase [Elusimicrobia bacterium HGW-Elusimicrobia-4]|nr:MAG: aldehyde:ferredoxin oxidoreductase [Elusimicrobia bacterium HGW-Elusimicrobia-4]
MLYGYAGKYLRIDLTKNKVEVNETPEKLVRKYLGGVGLGAKILWDELKPEVQPLSPENKIIFLTGPVNGTLFPPSGRYEVVSRSPQTGWWAHSSAGGFFGPEMKYAGYDYIIIQGKASHPVYINIDNDLVQIKDARHLWGKNVIETTDAICNDLGDNDVKVACIGQAGENLVKYACIMSDYFRAAGRTGMGCILGSKNLKAISIRGTKGIKIADNKKFMEILENAFERHTSRGKYWEHVNAMRRYGSFALTDWENAIGRLPTKNHWTGYFENAEETIGMKPMRERHYRRHASCFGCGIQCKYASVNREGKYAGAESEGPEYETVEAFTSNFLSTDTNSLIEANRLCNIYGLDTISVGHSISFAYECFEKGILTQKNTGGRKLVWGEKGMDTVIELLHAIANKSDKFASLLAEGSAAAAKKIGGTAWRYAIHVNKLEASGQDGRPHKSLGLTYAINVRGADHLTSLSSLDELGYREAIIERFGKKNVKVLADRLDENLKGYLVADCENLYAVVDSLLLCKYGTMWPPIYYWEDLGKIISAVTGFKEYENIKELKKLAGRICHLRRCFNVRLGWTKKQDALHIRFTDEPMPTGPAKGQVVQLEPMLKEYYEIRQYDWSTGLPTRDELENVGLKKVADELKKRKKLVEKYKGKKSDPLEILG